MIPAWHRMKGGAALLGARRPGESGPFGPYGAPDEEWEPEAGQAEARKPAARSSSSAAQRRPRVR
ncbi:hypothetical protein GCM10009716_24850 [Streptomyces sodiiphilus]|uniref:Uncharacterized protein n=1 Tax=Streptomyces sodiiphilus TaxID=226217 RepID=A0ABN2P7I7_9ACTN